MADIERTEKDIRSDICVLRNKVEDLQQEARELWEQDKATDELWHDLEDVAGMLGELEND